MAIIAISIFALAAVVYLFKQFVCKNLANTEPSDLKGDDIKDARLDPSWINDHPNTPLSDLYLGLDDYDKLKDYINEHGTELKCLNLSGHQIDNDQFEQLIKSCPNLTHLHLKGMPLTSVNFGKRKKLTDNALEHLKGMQLTSVDFSRCDLTDNALEYLKGMPLTSVNFSVCDLTDNALEHLKGMPLTSVEFSYCENLTDNALEYLKGMPLTSVSFWQCENLTDKALEHLKGMPLTSVSFDYCPKVTDEALQELKDRIARGLRV